MNAPAGLHAERRDRSAFAGVVETDELLGFARLRLPTTERDGDSLSRDADALVADCGALDLAAVAAKLVAY